jgi:ribonucleotide reductase alpha subunit
MTTLHPDYGKLAGYIVVSNNQKNTESSFYSILSKMYNFKDINNNNYSLVDTNIVNIVKNNKDFFQNMLNFDRDFLIDYFGFKTLERAYLFKINKKVIERPQHMWLRVAIGIHGDDLDSIKETYDLMSQKYFTHATPTLFNASTPRPQMSSCYLLGMEDDSIEGIFNSLKECGQISKWSGGIGLHIHNIRSSGSHIRGTNGTSNGIIPMLGVFNKTARYIDQGGKRNGSIAIYLEPHHPDIEEFLDLRKNTGDDELRARDLFYGLWISDLFMKRVQDNAIWSLFCPDTCPELRKLYGEEFEKTYIDYENKNLYKKQINARELWLKILDAQMETGTPYLLYKDHVNKKSNQKNIGTIMSSNLCTEIMEYSDDKESAVCNLASIGLPMFVKEDKTFDYNKLLNITKVITNNLNKIIDRNFYPNDKTRRSNLKHRPIGIGVQGLADVFMMMDIAFTSDEAKKINKNIFETIYFGALTKSCELSKNRIKEMKELLEEYRYENWSFVNDNPECRKYNIYNKTEASIVLSVQTDNKINSLLDKVKPIKAEIDNLENNYLGSYSSFIGSPISKNILQFDMWDNVELSKELNLDWNKLRKDIKEFGIRNSLLLAPMPTASTSQILGNNECFEPYTSNIYTRRTLAGEFMIINKHLINEFINLGIWNEEIKNNIIANKGSIQYINGISDHLKDKYKIVWEIPMKVLIDMSKDRGAFICQSQSLNLWMEDPDIKSLTNMHFYSWKQGLKTGIYYLRRKAKHDAQQFTIEPEIKKNEESEESKNIEEGCLMCSG